ncbi:hypothetical protein HUJ04_006958 [Dendroctonus ponderosae]|nr:hypothetical protein HUJ04_006958 [Dendroctonus ponderosae]
MDQSNKKRCTNFSKDEVETLMDLVETHRHVIECKKTDTVTNAAKAAEWRTIATTFNAICGTGSTGKIVVRPRATPRVGEPASAPDSPPTRREEEESVVRVWRKTHVINSL